MSNKLLARIYRSWVSQEMAFPDHAESITMSLETKLQLVKASGFHDSPMSKARIYTMEILIDNKMKPGEFKIA